MWTVSPSPRPGQYPSLAAAPMEETQHEDQNDNMKTRTTTSSPGHIFILKQSIVPNI